MSDQPGDRRVVDGSEPDGPLAPGQSGAPAAAASDAPVSGAADPGGSHADPDAGRMAGGGQPAAPNQQKTEPVPPSGTGDVPEQAAAGGSADAGAPAAPEPAGGLPQSAGGRPDDDPGTATGPGPREGWADPVPTSDHADAQGVPVPGETPAEGTSEGMAPIEGVTFPAVAPEGLADGETDVAMPSTTHF